MRRKRLHDAGNRGGKDDGGLGNFDEKLQGGCGREPAPCRVSGMYQLHTWRMPDLAPGHCPVDACRLTSK
jgi:hypothetical protein